MLARTMKMTVVAVALGAAVPAFAETLAIDGQVAIKPAGVETPQRGSTMTAVEQKFGAPSNKSRLGRAIRRSPSGSTRTSWWCSRTTRCCTRWSSRAEFRAIGRLVRARFSGFTAICTKRGEA